MTTTFIVTLWKRRNSEEEAGYTNHISEILDRMAFLKSKLHVRLKEAI
jgi:hypothetical protein